MTATTFIFEITVLIIRKSIKFLNYFTFLKKVEHYNTWLSDEIWSQYSVQNLS